ncbi:MAG: family 43 glycosylhydrolase [Oscillospiraceae bacterium]|nr:family 43 glycosylhydrolase [Oscillospiraceae bacterium]
MKQLLLYTRKPIESAIYDPKLAYSMHIAVFDGGEFRALNHNSGVFFAKAEENPDGSLTAKTLRCPRATLQEDGSYLVSAVRAEADGSGNDGMIFSKTNDFLWYEEIEGTSLPDSEDVKVDESLCRNIEGCVPSYVIEVSDEICDRLVKTLTTPENVAIEFPEEVEVSSMEELDALRAKAVYSDGSTDMKRVDWDLADVDFSKKGEYEIEGKIHQDHFEFPIATNRADPCVNFWEGYYYYIATNDADGNHTLYIRKAESIQGLVTAEEVLLLDSVTYEGIGGLLWAPEFHEIKGRLYIFHACTPGEFFREESHVMELREGGDPMNRDDWSRPKRVTKADGSDLAEAGKTITLDMTEFEWEGRYYVAWSQREFVPKDLGAWLMFAELDPDCPTRLLTEPVVISKPDYSWANNHTFVDEGPFALNLGDRLWLTFSSAAVDSTYVVSALILEKGKDPLDPKSWRKMNYPLLTSRSVPGEFGTGHNAYVRDGDGHIFNTYHARPGVDAPRSSGIRRVHFNVYGEPVLDMTEEIDVKPDLMCIKTKLVIK